VSRSWVGLNAGRARPQWLAEGGSGRGAKGPPNGPKIIANEISIPPSFPGKPNGSGPLGRPE